MNTYPNYFVYPYPAQSFIPNQYSVQVAPLSSDKDIKYIRLLESQNQLLREKVHSLQQKLTLLENHGKCEDHPTKKTKKVKKQTKIFPCPYPNCQRTYKFNLSLNLHIKMKHNGGSIREREAYAKLILECEKENKPKPQIKINFPPNFIENYRKRMELSSMSLTESLD